MKMHVPKAPWSAVAPATALSLGIQGSFAAALQGASRIFVQGGEPKHHGICAHDDSSFRISTLQFLISTFIVYLLFPFAVL